jgi:adenylate kinase
MKYLSECDLMVYDLHSGNPKDVELALAALKKHNIEEEKVLILISSLMVWNNTPPKMKLLGAPEKTGEEGEGGEAAEPVPEGIPEEAKAEGEDGAVQIQPVQPVVEEKPKKYVQVPYVEEDFRLRVPSEEYEEIKRIEDEVLSFKKDNVRIYVLASGIMYGAGECIFESHFKKAWLQQPSFLPYLGVGKNLVPTIHVKDLARMVKKIYETKPPLPDK